MRTPTPAERALYTDLTALLMRMQGESMGVVEAAIEERFQAFVHGQQPGGCGRLEITQSYTVHDDAEPWTEYRTEYRIGAMVPPPSTLASRNKPAAIANECTHAGSNIVPFPRACVRKRTMTADMARPRGF